MTPLSDVYEYVRVVLGDMAETPTYSDENIRRTVVTTLVLRMATKRYAIVGPDVIPAITGDDLKLLALWSAWFLLAPQAGTFAYQTPDGLSVSRGGHGLGGDPATSLLYRIERDIADIERSGANVLQSTGVIDAWKDEKENSRWEEALIA